MRSLFDTIERLRRAGPLSSGSATGSSTRLEALHNFGSNPGGLEAFVHAPPGLPPGAPLVVVLHGCTQTAHSYDHGSGWSEMADEFGFAVLYPQQVAANNPNLCFNWFSPSDMRRGTGEVESISQMIRAYGKRLGLDANRIFVTGLSAGGAMTAAMLATYPETFAGGAIIAGLPYGVATSVREAFDRMRGHGYDAAGLGRLIRSASPNHGPWPSVSVWHGEADHTVDPCNASMIIDQWRAVLEVDEAQIEDLPRGRQRTWRNAQGRAVLYEHLIAGMGHGTPIATSGYGAHGTPGPFMLDVGVSSTYEIAAEWGIVPANAPARTTSPKPASAAPRSSHVKDEPVGPAHMINKALRAAGLIKE